MHELCSALGGNNTPDDIKGVCKVPTTKYTPALSILSLAPGPFWLPSAVILSSVFLCLHFSRLLSVRLCPTATPSNDLQLLKVGDEEDTDTIGLRDFVCVAALNDKLVGRKYALCPLFALHYLLRDLLSHAPQNAQQDGHGTI